MAEFIIVGGGIAGLRAAVGLAPHGRVVVLTKADVSESNTGYAQGGIAAAVGADDSPDLHAADTVRAGDGLCDEAAVRVLVEEGVRDVRDLVDWGARFDREPDGRLALGREAAHSVRRVLHAGDATGREIGRVLWEHVSHLPSVEIISHARVTDLMVEDDAVCGVRYEEVDGVAHHLHAQATLLATGGAGQVFRETTNPAVATGDGIALAYHAGARVADLEFVQFHPTALNLPGAPRFLISEALRGEGARLVNAHGEPFMAKIDAAGDLAPRDVVARGIAREMERTGDLVFLTLEHLDAAYVRRRFPTITAMCASLGLDIAADRIPVGPAAHYMMGGVDADEWARTSRRGLFAAGEAACTGVHGANRLASNSLLEGLVFGARAAAAMREAPRAARLKPGWVMGDGGNVGANLRVGGNAGAGARVGGSVGADLRVGPGPADAPTNQSTAAMTHDAVRDLMWRSVGLFRSGASLADARMRLEAAARASMDDPRLRHLITVARLVARAALRREESRGGHFRSDFPQRDDRNWKRHVLDVRAAE
ncbi:MAG TPA: L-aspartate oxidase [Vicinamibacterales bacterium]|nr:L-aspartate oxidase [Vicinamibacterales bacterium]